MAVYMGQDNAVVITGGASGIGAAVAEAVVQEGGHVCLLDIDEGRIRESVRKLGARAVGYAADAASLASMQAAHQRLLDTGFPALTGLVNCAGLPPVPTAIEDQSVEDWERVLDSHLKTTYVSCKVFGGAMAAAGHGAIVNVASVLAFRPGPVLDYGPAKAAIVSLTQSLAVHWAARGLRVNAVAPGWTDTPFLRRRRPEGARDLSPIIEASPMRRLLAAAEIARPILFLLSAGASAITGVTLPCDGGTIAASGWAPYGKAAERAACAPV